MPSRLKHSTQVIILSFFLTAVFSVMFSVWSANKIADQSGDQAVCDILRVNLDAYKQSPPQSPLGKTLQVKYSELYEKC